jgi:hypothetical protein
MDDLRHLSEDRIRKTVRPNQFFGWTGLASSQRDNALQAGQGIPRFIKEF